MSYPNYESLFLYNQSFQNETNFINLPSMVIAISLSSFTIFICFLTFLISIFNEVRRNSIVFVIRLMTVAGIMTESLRIINIVLPLGSYFPHICSIIGAIDNGCWLWFDVLNAVYIWKLFQYRRRSDLQQNNIHSPQMDHWRPLLSLSPFSSSNKYPSYSTSNEPHKKNSTSKVMSGPLLSLVDGRNNVTWRDWGFHPVLFISNLLLYSFVIVILQIFGISLFMPIDQKQHCGFNPQISYMYLLIPDCIILFFNISITFLIIFWKCDVAFALPISIQRFLFCCCCPRYLRNRLGIQSARFPSSSSSSSSSSSKENHQGDLSQRKVSNHLKHRSYSVAHTQEKLYAQRKSFFLMLIYPFLWAFITCISITLTAIPEFVAPDNYALWSITYIIVGTQLQALFVLFTTGIIVNKVEELNFKETILDLEYLKSFKYFLRDRDWLLKIWVDLNITYLKTKEKEDLKKEENQQRQQVTTKSGIGEISIDMHKTPIAALIRFKDYYLSQYEMLQDYIIGVGEATDLISQSSNDASLSIATSEVIQSSTSDDLNDLQFHWNNPKLTILELTEAMLDHFERKLRDIYKFEYKKSSFFKKSEQYFEELIEYDYFVPLLIYIWKKRKSTTTTTTATTATGGRGGGGRRKVGKKRNRQILILPMPYALQLREMCHSDIDNDAVELLGFYDDKMDNTD